MESKSKKINTKKQKEKNEFVQYYHSNILPCKIQHGSIQNKLQWEQNMNFSDLEYNPILVKFYKGLEVNEHPYNFICTEAIKQLCFQTDAQRKIKPILKDIVDCLRSVFQNKNDSIILNGLQGLRSLSIGSKQDLNPYLKFLISSLSKQLNNKKLKKHVLQTLEIIEENGGQDALKAIKIKIPTYVSILQLIILKLQKIQNISQRQQFMQKEFILCKIRFFLFTTFSQLFFNFFFLQMLDLIYFTFFRDQRFGLIFLRKLAGYILSLIFITQITLSILILINRQDFDKKITNKTYFFSKFLLEIIIALTCMPYIIKEAYMTKVLDDPKKNYRIKAYIENRRLERALNSIFGIMIFLFGIFNIFWCIQYSSVFNLDHDTNALQIARIFVILDQFSSSVFILFLVYFFSFKLKGVYHAFYNSKVNLKTKINLDEY